MSKKKHYHLCNYLLNAKNGAQWKKKLYGQMYYTTWYVYKFY